MTFFPLESLSLLLFKYYSEKVTISIINLDKYEKIFHEYRMELLNCELHRLMHSRLK
jgi:hypothetical protein